MREEFETHGALTLAAGGQGSSGGPGGPSDPKLGRKSLMRIGDGLRAMYDDRPRQPIPQEWKDVLDRIDAAQKSIL